MKLTPKQEKFCNKYLECGNASEAYRYAYNCSKMSENVVYVKASELLMSGNISVRVKKIQSELQSKSDITKERVLYELGAILDSCITDYVNLVTKSVPVPQTKTEIEDGTPTRYIDVQVLVFKDFDQLTPKQVKAIESIKQGRNGVELKLHGKSWSIERICKMLGFDSPASVNLNVKNPFETVDAYDIIKTLERGK